MVNEIRNLLPQITATQYLAVIYFSLYYGNIEEKMV